MQNSVDSRCGGVFNVLFDGSKVGIAPPKRAFEGAVQSGDPNVEERLDCPSISAHLLLLNHPPRHNITHCTLDGCGRDGFAVPPAGAAIHQRGCFGFKVINEVFKAPPSSFDAGSIADMFCLAPADVALPQGKDCRAEGVASAR
jgi:hypothetical protein